MIPEGAAHIGWCHALVFDGDFPSWNEIRRIVYQGETHDRLVRHEVYKNRLNDRALAGSAKLWVDQYVKTPAKIKLGTGAPTPPQTGPLTTDEDCWTPDNTTERTCDVKTTFLTIYSEYGVTYATTELNDTDYTEALLMDEDGNAWAHAIINFSKNSNQTAVVLWKVTHSQS